jgi:hypothetical protein
MVFDETSSVGLVLTLDGLPGPFSVSDADAVTLAQSIMASDAVQSLPQWAAPPSLTSVMIDVPNTVYP